MRVLAKLGALLALASLSAGQTRPFAHVETTCSAQATETVFVTVFPSETSMSMPVGTETHSLSTRTIIPVSTYESVPALSIVTKTSSVGSALSIGIPAPSVSEGASIVTIETFTVPIGPAGVPYTGTVTITRICPGAVGCSLEGSAEPTGISSVSSSKASAPIEAASTFLLTTTITSGVSPKVVETSTYTVIETVSPEVPLSAPAVATSLPTSASIVETSQSMSTASFTLTLGTVTVPSTVKSSSPPSSSSPLVVTFYSSEPFSAASLPTPASVIYTVFTVTLPGLPGATPTVLTITATEAAAEAPLTPLPKPESVVTMTTTIYSGATEVSLTAPAPTVTDVAMTYTVTGVDGLALTTWTMSTEVAYTPPADEGTSYVTVSTVTAVNTVTVEGTVPFAPFPNITTPFVTTITPFPTAPGFTFTPPFDNSTVINITVPFPTGISTGAPIESPPTIITPGVTTIFVNGTPVATSIIVSAKSTTLVAPVSGFPTELPPSPTELPPSPTELPPSPTELPPSPTELPPSLTELSPSPTELPPSPTELPPSPTGMPPFPSTNGTVIPPLSSGSGNETSPAPTSGTASASTTMVIPLNSTTLVLPLPTNATSLGNVTISFTGGQSQGHGGASPTPPANGTAQGSPPANETTSGTVEPTPSVNSTIPAPASNQTATGGQAAPSQGGQGGHGGQGAPSGPPSTNVTSPAPTANQTASAAPQQSGTGQSAPSQGGQGGPAPTQGGQSRSQGAPTQGGQSQGQGAPTQGGQSQGQGGQSRSQGAPTQGGQSQGQGAPTQGGQSQGQGGQSRSQGAPTQGGQSQGQGAPTQGGQSQGQGGQSRSQGAPTQGGQSEGQGAPTQGGQSQGGQSQGQGAPTQGGHGQSQGQGAPTQVGQGQSQSSPAQTPPAQSQGEQGQNQGGQSRSQGPLPQGGQGGPTLDAPGNANPLLNTALGLPAPTGVPGASLSTMTTIITIVPSESLHAVQARAATTSAAASAACGNDAEQSAVVLDFDDLPTFQVQMATDGNADDFSPVPLYSPYHRFTFSRGFRVFPASVCPYKSSSGELMIEFSPSTKTYRPAEISLGILEVKNCFRFDFASLRVGCASINASCEYNVTGLAWDLDAQATTTIASHTFSTRACSDQMDCRLGSITADESTSLTNLTSILIDVTADGQPQTWWADDLSLSWTDSSCESAVCRSSVPSFVSKRGRRHGQNRALDFLP